MPRRNLRLGNTNTTFPGKPEAAKIPRMTTDAILRMFPSIDATSETGSSFPILGHAAG